MRARINIMKIFFVFSTAMMFFIGPAAAASEYLQLPAAIHISSTVSDGKYELEDIAGVAADHGIKILIPTDRDYMEWEYGLPPLRKVLKKKVSQRSVFSYGVKKYMDRLRSIQRSYPGLIIIPGIESSPYYYWGGAPWSGNFSINDWHKHLLVIGLENYEDLKGLPVLGNPHARVKFDQYHGNLGTVPYQGLIDYVKARGGLSFWAHPEASNVDSYSGIPVKTGEHPEYLLKTRNYTGFAVFHEGYKKVGVPGGIWDEILRDYCEGIRAEAVWAIAGVAYDKRGLLSDAIDGSRTVVLARSPDAASCLEAMRSGRMYAMSGVNARDFVLDDFTVCGKSMGQEAGCPGDPEIKISGYLLRGQIKPFTIELIRNGAVIKTFDAVTPFELTYADPESPAKDKSYYRIEIRAKDFKLISNPVFFKRQAQ